MKTIHHELTENGDEWGFPILRSIHPDSPLAWRIVWFSETGEEIGVSIPLENDKLCFVENTKQITSEKEKLDTWLKKKTNLLLIKCQNQN